MRDLPPLDPRQFGTFTAHQAHQAGWTAHALRHAVQSGRVDRLWKGVFAEPVTDDAVGRSRRLAQTAIGTALANHGAYVSHLAAASLMGWPTWARDPHPCVTQFSAGLTRVPGVHVHRSRMHGAERWRGGPVLITSADRTLVDVAREFGAEAGLVVADAALRSGRLGHADLRRAFDHAVGLPGITRVRDLPSLADMHSESPLETRSRFRMHIAGLPTPWTQVTLYDEFGVFLGRSDFYWPEFGVVGEADGKAKLTTEDERWRVIRREAAMRRTGLEFESWGYADLTPFEPTAARLRAAFGRGETVVARRRWRVGHADVGVGAVI